MSRFDDLKSELLQSPKHWLVTGAAGFIGSNLTELLLQLGQRVTGLDNFETGFRHNIEDVRERSRMSRGELQFIEGDITKLEDCLRACDGVEYVLHTAALGSVPRSIRDPIRTNAANIDGFLNMLVACRDTGVKRFVYSASSSTYGDHPGLPKVEHVIGKPLSPYAVTKLVNELYAGVFQRTYGLECIGLRYFNVFGRRQNPNGAYSAVIPRWIGNLLNGAECEIFGDGETSRDFCYIENVLQANLLAATADSSATGEVYNVAYGGRTTLNSVFATIRDGLARYKPELASVQPIYKDFRPGDVAHSQADITKASTRLGYQPTHSVGEGLAEALDWYVERLTGAPVRANA